MKEIDFDQLIKTIKGKRVPFSVVFELTRRCNLNCRHCYLRVKKARDTEELDLGEIKSLLNDLEQAGCLKLTLTGGEPTAREDFPEILSYSQEKGFAVTLFTNGTRLAAPVKKVLLRKPPLAVECSLYGATSKTHDEITRTPGSFERSARSIRWLAGNGIRVVVKTVLFPMNLPEVDALHHLCREWGVLFHPTFRVFPSLDPDRTPENLRLDDGEMKTLLRKKGRPFFAPPSEPGSSQEDWICNAGREACCISAEGKVYPCVALRWESGDLRKASFPVIWHDSPVLNRIRSYQETDFRECSRCSMKGQCRFCPGLGFFEHGDMLKPSGEMCRITRMVCSQGETH